MSVDTKQIIDFDNISIQSMPFLDEIVDHLHNYPDEINKQVLLSVKNEKNSWLSAWVLSKYIEKYPNSFDNHAKFFVDNITNVSREGQIRQLLIILRNTSLDEMQSSLIYDFCFSLFENNKLQSSLRCHAFLFMWEFAQDYPELKAELSLMFDRYKDCLSTGIRHSIERVIRKTK